MNESVVALLFKPTVLCNITSFGYQNSPLLLLKHNSRLKNPLANGYALESYRAAIGAFYAVTHKLVGRRTPVSNVNILFNMYCVLNIFWLLSIASFIRNDQFKFYIFIILLICMDIHTNPGPTLNDKHALDIIHLNTRSIRNKMENL